LGIKSAFLQGNLLELTNNKSALFEWDAKFHLYMFILISDIKNPKNIFFYIFQFQLAFEIPFKQKNNSAPKPYKTEI